MEVEVNTEIIFLQFYCNKRAEDRGCPSPFDFFSMLALFKGMFELAAVCVGNSNG